MGAAIQADLVHRARMPGHRPRYQPAQRLLRPEVVRELHAAFLAGLAGRRHPAGLSRGDVSLVGRGREQPGLVGLRWPHGARPRMRRLDVGRAALSVLPGADRCLDRRRELAARTLADRAAGRGVAGGAGPAPLLCGPGMPERRIDVTGLWGAVEGYAIGALESPRASITTLSRHFRLRRGRDRGRDPLRHARPGGRRHRRA